jgi:HEAT repeat protein
MTSTTRDDAAGRLRAALRHPDASSRLQAALTAGTRPDDRYIPVLVARCAVEPDFFVRDMLTWALTRHEPRATVDAVIPELRSSIPQARSQGLHTLSKIGDPRGWTAITPALLGDHDDAVARAAWRTAAGLVPAGEEEALAGRLAGQFGRAGRDTHQSLSRAFVMLGDAARPIVERAVADDDPAVAAHALATLTTMDDPEGSFDAALAAAEGEIAQRGRRS